MGGTMLALHVSKTTRAHSPSHPPNPLVNPPQNHNSLSTNTFHPHSQDQIHIFHTLRIRFPLLTSTPSTPIEIPTPGDTPTNHCQPKRDNRALPLPHWPT